MIDCSINIVDRFYITLGSDKLNALSMAQEIGIRALVHDCRLLDAEDGRLLGSVDIYVSKESDYITALFKPEDISTTLSLVKTFKECFEVWASGVYYDASVTSVDVVVRVEF